MVSGVRDKANDESQNKRSVSGQEAVRLVKYVPRRGCDRNPIQMDSPWFSAAKPQVHGTTHIPRGGEKRRSVVRSMCCSAKG